jgi:hypothetical protein
MQAVENRLEQIEQASWQTVHFSHPDYNSIGAGIAIFASIIGICRSLFVFRSLHLSAKLR